MATSGNQKLAVDTWGIIPTHGGKTIWFTVERR